MCNYYCPRWDLAGYLYFGGEGETYDLRQVTKLAKEAELLGEKLDLLGKPLKMCMHLII